MQLGMRKLIQEILEREIQEDIGSAYYAHGNVRNGYRNRYEPAHLKDCGEETVNREASIG